MGTDIFFFTDVEALQDVRIMDSYTEFGVIDENKFHLTSLFPMKNQGHIYAMMSGSALFLEQVNDNNKVNVILKPQLPKGIKMPVKYIVYRSLKKTDDIFCAKVNETDMVDKYFYPCNYESGNGMLPVEAGDILGTFEKNSKCGLEIILENSDLEFTIEKALLPDWTLELTTEDTQQNRWKRQQIRHFVDPAAFYGLHSNIDGGIGYCQSNVHQIITDQFQIGNIFLKKLQSKTILYIDVRDNVGYSSDCYNNELFEITVCDDDFSFPPINNNSSYQKWAFHSFERKSDYFFVRINFNHNFPVVIGKYFNVNTNNNNKEHADVYYWNSNFSVTISLPTNLSTIVRFDLKTIIENVNNLMPINISVHDPAKDCFSWQSSYIEKLYKTQERTMLMHSGVAKEWVNNKNNNEKILYTYYSFPKIYLSENGIVSMSYPFHYMEGYSKKTVNDQNFLFFFDKKILNGKMHFGSGNEDTKLFFCDEEFDFFLIGITQDEKKCLLDSLLEEKEVFFFQIQNGIDNNEYLLSVYGKDTPNYVQLYSKDNKIFISKDYSDEISNVKESSKVSVEFVRLISDQPQIYGYGFDWFRHEKYLKNYLYGREVSQDEILESLKNEYTPEIIGGKTYYIPWLSLRPNCKATLNLKTKHKKKTQCITFIYPQNIEIEIPNASSDMIMFKNNKMIVFTRNLKQYQRIIIKCLGTISTNSIIEVLDEKDFLIGKLNIFHNDITLDCPIHFTLVVLDGPIKGKTADIVKTYETSTNPWINYLKEDVKNDYTSNILSQAMISYQPDYIVTQNKTLSINSYLYIRFRYSEAEQMYENITVNIQEGIGSPIEINLSDDDILKFDSFLKTIQLYNHSPQNPFLTINDDIFFDCVDILFKKNHFLQTTIFIPVIEWQRSNNANTNATSIRKSILLLHSNVHKHIIAHEIAHTLGLKHSFYKEEEKEKNNLKKYCFEENKTDNIMDYTKDDFSPTEKNSFWKWQWEQIIEKNNE